MSNDNTESIIKFYDLLNKFSKYIKSSKRKKTNIELLKKIIGISNTKLNEIIVHYQQKGGYQASSFYVDVNKKTIDFAKQTKKKYTYWIGFARFDSTNTQNRFELIEYAETSNTGAYRVPMYIQLLDARNNWVLLNFNEAKKMDRLDLVVSNNNYMTTKGDMCDIVTPKKGALFKNKESFNKNFYNSSPQNFIPMYKKFNANSKYEEFLTFNNKQVIIKPDLGSYGKGIMAYDNFNKNIFDIMKQHISNYPVFADWTISEYIKSKLYKPSNTSKYYERYHNAMNNINFWEDPVNFKKYKICDEIRDIPTWDNLISDGLVTRPRIYMLITSLPDNDGGYKLSLYYYDVLHINSTPRGRKSHLTYTESDIIDLSNKLKTMSLKDLINGDKTYFDKFSGSLYDPYASIVNYSDDLIFTNNTYIKHKYRHQEDCISLSYEDYVNTVWPEKGDIIKSQVKFICESIFNKYKDDIVCKNGTCKNDENGCFCIFGIDTMISQDLDGNPKVYVAEINGYPYIGGYHVNDVNIEYYLDENYPESRYGTPEIYIPDLINNALFLSVDKIKKPEKIITFTRNNDNSIKINAVDYSAFLANQNYEPLQYLHNGNLKRHNGFVFVKELVFPKIETKKFYLSKQRQTTAPSMHDLLVKRNYEFTKNSYDDITVMLSPPDLYNTDNYKFGFYDELVDHDINKNRYNLNSVVLNKISGLTYYLASKDNLYFSLMSRYDYPDFKFHPVSYYFVYNDKQQIEKILNTIDSAVTDFILKPVFGSQEQGIIRINNIKNNIDTMVNHMEQYKNGVTKIVNNTKTITRYTYWMLSQYLSDPWLYCRSNDKLVGNVTENVTKYKVKTNFRFYGLLVIKKIPSLKSINNSDIDYDIEVYPCKKGIIYLAMKNYSKDSSDEKVIITNLQVAKDHYKSINIDPNNAATDYTRLFPQDYDNNPNTITGITSDDVYKQYVEMLTKCVESVKDNLRCENRNSPKFKGCFNLLAFDTLLDSTGKLYLIEINRYIGLAGPAKTFDTDASDLFKNIKNVHGSGINKFMDEVYKLSLDNILEEKNVSDDFYYFESVPVKIRLNIGEEKGTLAFIKHLRDSINRNLNIISELTINNADNQNQVIINNLTNIIKKNEETLSYLVNTIQQSRKLLYAL